MVRKREEKLVARKRSALESESAMLEDPLPCKRCKGVGNRKKIQFVSTSIGPRID